MAFVYNERVQESTLTIGTIAFVLAGTPDSTFQSFSAVMADGDTTDVTIFGAGAFESRRVTYQSSTNSLLRDGLIYSSSNSGAAVTFGAGSKIIIMNLPGALAQELVTGEVDYGLVTGTATMADDYGSVI